MFGQQVSREREYWGWFVLAFLLYGLTPLDAVFQAMLGTNNLIDGVLILCAIVYGSVRWGMAFKKERAANSTQRQSARDGVERPVVGENESARRARGSHDEVSA